MGLDETGGTDRYASVSGRERQYAGANHSHPGVVADE
jgi:hypothetical protein